MCFRLLKKIDGIVPERNGDNRACTSQKVCRSQKLTNRWNSSKWQPASWFSQAPFETMPSLRFYDLFEGKSIYVN